MTTPAAQPTLPLVPVETGELWTARQRQASSIHEISYRACFKPQLPAYFISRYSEPGDTVYDPFAGRGTTAIETALHDRRILSNDTNPLSRILLEPRLELPEASTIEARLTSLDLTQPPPSPLPYTAIPTPDLSMFYEARTLAEIHALRHYLQHRRATGAEDPIDRWLRMVATNRLTGHSPGFFSVYTLPPNQATSAKRQLLINQKRNQTPAYRDVKKLIWKKTRQLLSNLTPSQTASLRAAAPRAHYLESSATHTPEIPDASVALTVTSPPFLDIVQYDDDNWLRCWFNHIDTTVINPRITMTRTHHIWATFIREVFAELHRITRPGGHVAFEVGEIRYGKVRLEETVVPAAAAAGFHCEKILINTQTFTKTANIWGIKNNTAGTNTNRIVLLRKPA
ncbi:site-specific DNA-methyltransferase [Opitutaceae bacterium TAV4]|nr:site-specific DNA-methyltransferase [Opitutaceae bacterium TAV4]RRK00045.1 site-specific DNA-methyltransferase [Opitutaceae bacterium TAV3]